MDSSLSWDWTKGWTMINGDEYTMLLDSYRPISFIDNGRIDHARERAYTDLYRVVSDARKYRTRAEMAEREVESLRRELFNADYRMAQTLAYLRGVDVVINDTYRQD